MAQVKQNYFAVLVAQESVTINEALVRFTAEVYRIQDDKLKVGVVTPYEPRSCAAWPWRRARRWYRRR